MWTESLLSIHPLSAAYLGPGGPDAQTSLSWILDLLLLGLSQNTSSYLILVRYPHRLSPLLQE